MNSIVSEILSELPIDYHPSDVLVRRVDNDQSFLEIRTSQLENIKDNILKSLIDLRAEVYHDANEKVERQDIIDSQMERISIAGVKIRELDLERERINQERLKLAEALELEREKLRREVLDLLQYRRKIDERRFIRQLVYEIAVPSELMNYKKIEDFINEHQREIEKLERMKIGASPSQIELINRQIAELEIKFNDQLNDIDFQCDENGQKFYYDQNGVKTYLIECRVFMDELGDYVVDVNGKKSYLREYANDENGRFYLDADDNRIYKATPNSPECRLLNGVLIRFNDKSGSLSPSSSHEECQESDVHSISSRSEYLKFLVDNFAQQLKKALVDIMWKHPIDPVHYLQRFLGHFERTQVQISMDEKFFENLEQKRRIIVRQIFDAQIIEKRKLYA